MPRLMQSYRDLLDWAGQQDPVSRPGWLRYGLAVLYVALATVARLVLPLDSVPYLFYITGALPIGFVLGLGPGAVEALLAIPCAVYVSILHGQVNIFRPGSIIGQLFYLSITLVMVVVCDAFRRSIRQQQGNLKALQVANEVQKHSEAQLRLLNHELGHRLKNTLAMVQAIANQTLRRANSLPEAQASFEARLIALGKAQDVLVSEYWERAGLREVVDNALAPHIDTPHRFRIQGPELRLSSRCSLALSLALHELATNAAKYGALSVESGRIEVTWRVAGADPDAVLSLDWIESHGPLVVAPAQTGFGSVMIERSLGGYFKGRAKISYPPDGVRFALSAPVTYDAARFQSGTAEIQAC